MTLWYKCENLNKMENFLEKHNTETKARKIVKHE